MHAQIVKFKLKPDTSRELFFDLTDQMIAWLKEQEGFVGYELYKGSEYWFDRIVWENATHAQDGLKCFLETPTAKQMTELVEDGYDSFFGEALISA